MATYTTVLEVCERLGLAPHEFDTVTADSGVSEPNADRVFIAIDDVSKYPIGANVQVVTRDTSGDSIRKMEQRTILARDLTTGYVVLSTDLTLDFTTAENAGLRLMVPFSEITTPRWSEIEEMIKQNEDEIDSRTHFCWRERVEFQYVDFKKIYRADFYQNQYTSGTWRDSSAAWFVELNQRMIKTLDKTADVIYTGYTGDFLAIWDGSELEEWVNDNNAPNYPSGATKFKAQTEGRENDFWLDYENGVLFFVNDRPTMSDYAIKIRYRYGDSILPSDATNPTEAMAGMRDIKKACRLMCMAEIMLDERYQVYFPGGDEAGAVPPRAASREMQDQADRILLRHTEIVGYYGESG